MLTMETRSKIMEWWKNLQELLEDNLQWTQETRQNLEESSGKEENLTDEMGVAMKELKNGKAAKHDGISQRWPNVWAL